MVIVRVTWTKSLSILLEVVLNANMKLFLLSIVPQVYRNDLQYGFRKLFQSVNALQDYWSMR